MADAPAAQWRCDPAQAACTLQLSGDWSRALPALPPPPEVRAIGRKLDVDARGLTAWQPALAATLWQRLAPLHHQGVLLDLAQLPQGLRDILLLALPAVTTPPPAALPPGPQRMPWRQQLLHRIGQRASAGWTGAQATLTYLGEVLLAVGRLLRGRSSMRWSDLAWQIDQTGPRSVPIVALVCGLVGLIVAYMGAVQLQRFGAQSYIADLVTVGVVREIAALMTGVILAGRIGAAFAAQLGSMQANEELDALRTLGLDPIDHLVLPRVLAMLLVAPLLTAIAALMGTLAGGLVSVAIFGVMPLDFLARSQQALTLTHVLIGLFKGTVYALLVALSGCLQGLQAGRSAEAVGAATTAAVVQSIVWIVVAASLLTIMFQRLNW
ncbi:MAG: ABC transporter permease [Burkholderiales bacterium]